MTDLHRWHAAFESHRAEARALVDNHPRAVLNAQTDPTQWSALQILAHLNVTAAMLLPKLRHAADRNHPHDVSLGRLDGFFERDASDQGLEDDGLHIVPAFDHDPAKVLARFEGVQNDLISLCDHGMSSGEHSGASVASWLEGTWAHQARHLSEARSTVAALEAAAA